MNSRIVSIGIVCAVLSATLVASAQAQSNNPPSAASPSAPGVLAGTAIRYQGQLKSGYAPVNGTCEIVFRLYDAVTVGSEVGSALTQSIPITNGLFTTSLDFGAVFGGNSRWLDMQVRCPPGGGAYTQLSPRQLITPVPIALFSTAPWVTNNGSVSYAGYVGIGTATTPHLLSISGGPAWTTNNWAGAVSLSNGSAIGWQANNTGQRAGIGHANDGIAFFRTGSDLGATAGPAIYDVLINNAGNVGIGTLAPAHRLSINGGPLWTSNGWAGAVELNNGAAIGWQSNGVTKHGIGQSAGGLYFFHTASAPGTTGSPAIYDMQINDNGTVRIGALAPNGTTHACYYTNELYFGTCSSAAEYVPTIDIGAGYPISADLVSIVPAVKNPYGDDHAPFVVAKSATPCDANLLGFIVNPESGADGKKVNEHYLPLAIYGYFAAKVTLENGAIKRGDPLTSSSKPGYGMKATSACKIIGYALEDANKEGTIQVFANHGESAAPEVMALRTKVQELEDQNAALDARLDAIEKILKGLKK